MNRFWVQFGLISIRLPCRPCSRCLLECCSRIRSAPPENGTAVFGYHLWNVCAAGRPEEKTNRKGFSPSAKCHSVSVVADWCAFPLTTQQALPRSAIFTCSLSALRAFRGFTSKLPAESEKGGKREAGWWPTQINDFLGKHKTLFRNLWLSTC